ncbi:MAG: response regulator [Proteobacteria bacterium]|nr:response regulator [Pseudomonadota bacterium]
MKVLFVTKDSIRFFALEAKLRRQQELELVVVATGAAGLTQIKGKQVDLVIVDEQLVDMSGIAFGKQLVKVNPLVNSAMLSTLTDEAFHEATEGLGVLIQLPSQPQEKHADALLAILQKISSLLQPVVQQS